MSQRTDEPKLKLQLPKSQLRRPERSGSGMLIAGGVVVAVVMLLWLLRGGESSRQTEVRLTPNQGSDAADQVDRLTKELIEGAKEKKPSNLLQMAGENPLAQSLNGVRFKISIPTDWKASSRDTSIIVRKEKDPRICQLTASSQYDTLGLIAEVKGKEAEFEAEFTKQGSSQGAPGAQVVASGKLLASNYGKTQLHYAVRTRTRMTVAGKSMEQGGVNAVYAVGKHMVRLQCANMSDTSDEGNVMGTMGRTLLIPNS